MVRFLQLSTGRIMYKVYLALAIGVAVYAGVLMERHVCRSRSRPPTLSHDARKNLKQLAKELYDAKLSIAKYRALWLTERHHGNTQLITDDDGHEVYSDCHNNPMAKQIQDHYRDYVLEMLKRLDLNKYQHFME